MPEADNPSTLNTSPFVVTLFASAVSGNASTEEIAFGNYRDECFVLASTNPKHPLRRKALALTIDTALWAFKLVRLRPFYRLVQDKLLYRIARSTNILLWQRQREPEYGKGLFATLLMAIASQKNMLIGFVGKSEAYLWRDRTLTKVVPEKGDREAVQTLVLGKDRYGITTATYSKYFVREDTYLMVSASLVPLLDEAVIKKYLSGQSKTDEELAVIATGLLDVLTKGKSGGKFGLGLVKRIRYNTSTISVTSR